MCLLILLNATALGNWVFSLCLQAVSIIAWTRNLKLPHSKSALSFLHRTWEIQGVFSSFPAYPGGLKFPNRQKVLRLQKKMGRSWSSPVTPLCGVLGVHGGFMGSSVSCQFPLLPCTLTVVGLPQKLLWQQQAPGGGFGEWVHSTPQLVSIYFPPHWSPLGRADNQAPRVGVLS